MSGLNVYHHELRPDEYAEFYLKYEADKVITELEERIADGDKDFEMADHQNERLLKIIQHHKFKRCLAMAKWCNSEAFYAEAVENDDKRADWLGVWTDKWEKLAEKFKTN